MQGFQEPSFSRKEIWTYTHLNSDQRISSQEAVITKLCPPACTSNGNITISQMLQEDSQTENLFASLNQQITYQ